MTDQRFTSTVAERVRPGDTILLDPLDCRSVADVAEIERSQFSTTVTFTVVYRGALGTVMTGAEHPVRRLS